MAVIRVLFGMGIYPRYLVISAVNEVGVLANSHTHIPLGNPHKIVVFTLSQPADLRVYAVEKSQQGKKENYAITEVLALFTTVLTDFYRDYIHLYY